MKKEQKITVATRLSLTDLAKARDGLINIGIPAETLKTKSAVIRTAVLLAISKTENPTNLPTDASINILS